MWRARVSRCLALFLVSLFSPDTGKYGDQIAIRNRINIEGRIASFVFLSMFRCPCTSETVSAMVLLVTLGTGLLIMKG